jgi:hypothetical protein
LKVLGCDISFLNFRARGHMVKAWLKVYTTRKQA